MCVSASLILLCYLLCPLHTQMGGKCIASLTELVGLGPCLSPPSLPDGQHFGPHREREVVSGGDDETLLARHTPQLPPGPKAGLQQPSDLEGCLADANGFPSFTAELQGQSETALN